VKGKEAEKLFEEAQVYLNEIIEKKFLVAKGVLGLFPAVSHGDDVKILHEKDSNDVKATLRFLRNQEKKENGQPNLSLSDYIAPEGSGLRDNIGVFAVTVSIVQEAVEKYRDDDYATIMLRILSDRMAEAVAEWLHEKVRKEHWGYAADEKLTTDELLKLKYKGIRPAPGYPACPDHTEKETLFDLIGAEENIGIRLTENFAMSPPASVCGYIFSHPGSVYFNLGKIDREQLKDYAKRKNITVEEAARWLAPNL
jgi:5-methyltetrahydrofolate--homocysteine methyltransferase